MPNVPRVGNLELGQDLAYQRREWTFERLGWVCLVLIVLAGLLGLLGGGPLSSTSAADPAGRFRLEYNRFIHCSDSETLEIALAEEATQGTEVRLWLAQEYLDRVHMTRISPEPERSEIGASRQVFVFAVADRGWPARIVIRFQAERTGSLAGQVGVGDGAALEFWQFAYP